MNSNAVHNFLNIAIALSAGGTAALLSTGCTALSTGALECSSSWVNPTWATAIIAGLGAVKLAINFFRDGLDGMTRPQPPVQK